MSLLQDTSSQEYFVEANMKEIQGLCQQFISEEQATWRTIDELEQYPLRRVAKYCRNVKYTQLNTRSPQCLKKCLDYLCENVLPQASQPKGKRVLEFLYEVIKAIRCQYFVQGVIWPTELIRIIKLMLIIETICDQKREFIGLEHLVSPANREIMQLKYMDIYHQALQMSILAVPKQSLLQLLARHDDIFEVRMLQKALRLRLNIDENNYNAYFVGLESYDPIGKCVLWNRINLMRESVCNIVRKSQREVSSTWLGQILGIKTKQGKISLAKGQKCHGEKYEGILQYTTMTELIRLFDNQQKKKYTEKDQKQHISESQVIIIV